MSFYTQNVLTKKQTKTSTRKIEPNFQSNAIMTAKMTKKLTLDSPKFEQMIGKF